MDRSPTASRLLRISLHVFFALFFISLFFSFRAISSISTVLLIIAGLVYEKTQSGRYISTQVKNIFLAACGVLFFAYVAGAFNSTDSEEALDQLRIKLGLLFIPLSVCICAGFIL